MVAETVEVSNEAACSALLALLSEYSLSSSSSSLSSASVYALEAGGHALGKLVVPVWWCTIWSRGVREHALPSLLDRAMASVCIAQAWLRLYSTALLCDGASEQTTLCQDSTWGLCRAARLWRLFEAEH